MPPQRQPREAARTEPERRAPDPLAGLREPNGPVWLRNLRGLLEGLPRMIEQVNAIAAHSFGRRLDRARDAKTVLDADPGATSSR